eukprot:g2573.t1
MWNDTQHPPTHYLGPNDREKIFTHGEWVQLRDKLFAFKQRKDTFMCEKAYRFSMQMNALQDIYSFPNATVCKSQCIIAAGKCAEAAAQIFLPPDDGQSTNSVKYVYRQKANGDQYVYKIKVWGTDHQGNQKWLDSLDAHITFLVSQNNIVPEHITNALDKLRKYGNSRHENARDLQLRDRPRVAACMFVIGKEISRYIQSNFDATNNASVPSALQHTIAATFPRDSSQYNAIQTMYQLLNLNFPQGSDAYNSLQSSFPHLFHQVVEWQQIQTNVSPRNNLEEEVQTLETNVGNLSDVHLRLHEVLPELINRKANVKTLQNNFKNAQTQQNFNEIGRIKPLLTEERQTLKRKLQEAGDAYELFLDARKLQNKTKKLLDRAARDANTEAGVRLQTLSNRIVNVDTQLRNRDDWKFFMYSFELGKDTYELYKYFVDGQFQSRKEAIDAKHCGVTTHDDYEIFTQCGFGSNDHWDDYQYYLRGNFTSKNEMVKARDGGFSNRADYIAFTKLGFENYNEKTDYEFCVNRNFTSKREMVIAR